MIRVMLVLIILCSFNALFSQFDLKIQLKTLVDKEQLYDSLVDSIAIVQKKVQNQSEQNLELSTMLENQQTQKSILYREILEIKANLYDAEQAEPVWAEGVGEIIPDEKKPYEQNKRLALMYARRDAMEKGGKIILETMMRLERFDVIEEENGKIVNKYVEEFRSIIQSKGKVKVLDQDLSGDYGKALTIKEDDVTKLRVTVRLKMNSMDDFNPFREELEKFKNNDR